MVLIIGPRLDRPSAIGVEGRARAASLAIATAVVVGYTAVLTDQLSLWKPLNLAVLGIGLVVVGTALVDREEALAPFIGHFCFLPGGLLVLAGVAVAGLRGPGVAVIVAALILALFGVGAAWADSLGRGRLTTAIEGGAIATTVLVVVIGVLALVLGVGALAWLAVESVVLPARRASIAGVLLLSGVALLALRTAIGWLPIVELAAPARRAGLADRVDLWRRVSLWLGTGGVVGWLIVHGLGLLGAVPPAATTVPANHLLGAPLRLALALLTVIALAGAGLAWLTQQFAGLDAESAQRLAPVGGTLGLVSLPIPILTWLFIGLTTDRNALVTAGLGFVLVVVGAILALAVLSLIVAVAGLDLLPDRAAPHALVAAGLLGVALGGGVVGAPPPVVFVGAVGALVTWDVTEFGLGLTQEVGHVPETRHVELLHGVVSVGVAVVGVVVAWSLYVLVRFLGPATGAIAPVTILAVLGTITLLAAVRG